jgi:ABC-type multidrug transport system fused ATPase/permease subunit
MEDLLRLAGLDRLLELKPETKKKEDEYFFDDIDSAENHGINFKLNDGGNSLSMGEKQLLCICRAVLRRNKIIILDEATANIDIVTEQKIYKLIESAFAESTVLTIAHRLNTVLSSDKVLVIDKGKVVEFDSPKVLARDPNSRLTYLLQDIEKDD